MSNLVDSDTTTVTDLADDGTDSLEINTDKADTLLVFIDNGSDSDHAGYELLIEYQTPSEGYMEYTTLGSDSSPETARAWDIPSIPRKIKITLTNRSGGAASHAMYAASVQT